jgi:hypothetical protein
VRPEHKDTFWFVLSISPEIDYAETSRRGHTPRSQLRGWIAVPYARR